MTLRRLALLTILTVCGVSCPAFAIIRYRLYKGVNMARKTWDFLDLGQGPTIRAWAELLVAVLILVFGFASAQIILHHAIPCGPGQPTDHCAPQPHPQAEMRWDQSYLHEFSRRPCSAVYDAPNGDLRQCL